MHPGDEHNLRALKSPVPFSGSLLERIQGLDQPVDLFGCVVVNEPKA